MIPRIHTRIHVYTHTHTQTYTQSKKDSEHEMVELQEMISRRKQELEMYEEKLRQLGRLEGMGVSRETELEAREREIKAKEEELRSREEWLLQKEGQQRAARK